MTRFSLTLLFYCISYIQIFGQAGIGSVRDSILEDSIVIIDYHSRQSFYDAQSAISLVTDPLDQSLPGIGALLTDVPGVFSDASLGEVYTRVYTRGISASAEDDIGWFYQSLQEDGLPVSAIQYNYFTPDLFQRTDLMTQKLEVIRGGKSGILFQNSPGGSINFINSNAQQKKNQFKATVGVLGEGNPYYRSDILLSFPAKENGISLLLAGFYRHDEGHRNTDYAWNRGGQLRSKVQKIFNKGVVNLNVKYLNDHVNRHTGLSATNWENPEAAYDQNLNYTALMLPELETQVAGPESYDFNAADGIHVQDLTFQPALNLSFDNLEIDVKGKLSYKSTDWNTSFANQPLGLDNFLPYFLSGAQNPFGNIRFSDVRSGETVAIVNNLGALNAFQGLPTSFEYIEGSLPNDALMGIAPWKKQDELDEQMLQLVLSNDLGQHEIAVGGFYSHSSLNYYTSASYAFATFEAEPRLLATSLINPDGSEIKLSDSNGMSNYGGLFFEKGSFDVDQFALFANDHFDITERLHLDMGLRYESINHDGLLEIPAQFDMEGGLDGDLSTEYDLNTMVASGQQEGIDFSYDFLSYSAGVSYDLSQTQKLIGRFSESNKAPELNQYIQNFSGLPIDEAGEIQTVRQYELGYRIRHKSFNLAVTAFRSELKNIGLSDFLFDQQTGEIFYAPVQINETQTSGLELQWQVDLSEHIYVNGSQTIQNSEAVKYTVYDAAGTADPADDALLDFSGKQLPHTPEIMSKISLGYDRDKLKASMSWQYLGSRFGNAENSFTLNPFSSVGLNAAYELSQKVDISLQITNLFNSAGLMNFFGPNEFGSSANQATEAYIENNPNASFVVFPILPRAIYLSGAYCF